MHRDDPASEFEVVIDGERIYISAYHAEHVGLHQ